MASYTFSHPASPDDVHGTGWLQQNAGIGKGPSERHRQGMAIRAGQQMQPLPVVASPLRGHEIRAFAQEWAADNAPLRNVAKDMIISGVLGYALTRVIQTRRGR